MTHDRGALRGIAQRLKTGEGLYQSIMSVYPSPSPRWYEDVQQIADYVLAITAPLLVTCRECGGSGQLDEIKDDIKCDACHGKGSVEREDIAAIRKRFEDAAHAASCSRTQSDDVCSVCGAEPGDHYGVPCAGSVWQLPPCNCWKSTFGLDALLDLIAAQAREIERLKEK